MDAHWAEEEAMLRMAVAQINDLAPRFLLVSGDMTNAEPNDWETNRATQLAQVSCFKDALMELDPSIPVFFQPGNHDIGSNPSPAEVERYQARFGDDFYSYWVGGVLYLSLNSQYYAITAGRDCLPLRREQDAWIDSQLASASASGAHHVVLLSHAAPFLGDEAEAHGYFNWELTARTRVLRAAEKAGVRLWVCGHYHQNVEQTSAGGINVVTSSACGGTINWKESPAVMVTKFKPRAFLDVTGRPPVSCDSQHAGLRLFRCGEHAIEHRWFPLSSMPSSFEHAFDHSPKESGPQIADILGLPSKHRRGGFPAETHLWLWQAIGWLACWRLMARLRPRWSLLLLLGHGDGCSQIEIHAPEMRERSIDPVMEFRAVKA